MKRKRRADPEPRANFRLPSVVGKRRNRVREEDLSTLARRAFRRPVAEVDIQTLMFVHRRSRRREFRARNRVGCRGHPGGARNFCIASSASRAAGPSVPSTESATSNSHRVSRLSWWSSIPDDTLLDVASSGKLRNPGRPRTAGSPDAGPSALGSACHQFRRTAGLFLREPADGAAGFEHAIRTSTRIFAKDSCRETQLLAGSILRDD